MKENAKSRLMYLLYPLPLLALVALCVPFLNNPLVFDDMYFFLAGEPAKFLASGFQFAPRWWVHQTLALPFVHIGPEILWLRIGNLAFHILVAIALFFLVRRLIRDLDVELPASFRPETAAFVAATLFAFHPLANFAQGYLIERTILCATLFALICWLLFWRGMKGSRLSLWGSIAAFGMSVFAKEHAIMVPAICFFMLILYMRSGLKLEVRLPEVLAALILQGLIAIYVVLQLKGLLVRAYEPLTGEMLGKTLSEAQLLSQTKMVSDALANPAGNLYLLSVLNQAGLFFKYLLLWIMPNPGWISLDMREPFPSSFGSWLLWAGTFLYLAFGTLAGFLLFRGRTVGLAGMAMLGCWTLFFTEFSTVRLQEPFVLYRSYLWMPLLFVALALGARRLSKKLLYAIFPMLAIFFMALSLDRLTVLSHSYFIWDEAARLFEGKKSKEGVFGGYRIYYNRGHAMYKEGMLDAAMADYERSAAMNPAYAYAFHEQGVVFLDLGKWEQARNKFGKAIKLMPAHVKSWSGLGYAFERLGDEKQAHMSFLAACSLGSAKGCEKAGIDINPEPKEN